MSVNFLSAQAVVLDLLRNIGVTGFTPPDNEQLLNQPGIDDDDIRRALIAVNSGLQTIQKWGPQDLKYGRRSATYGAPLQVPLAVTTGSKAATGTLPAAALGCSIRIEGDSDLNRVMNIAGTAVTLLRSHLGPTASTSATVFFDCALLDPDVQAVQEPVLGTGKLRLYPCSDLDEFERLRDRYWSYYWSRGGGGMSYTAYVESLIDSIGTPSRFYVERQRNGTPFLRVTPMTAVNFNVTFQAKLRAERITDAVLDTDGGPDPGYEFKSLHADEVEGVLLPIARWRFFVHPALKNAETRASIKAEYDEVMRTLMSGTTMQSSVTHTRGSYT